MAQNTWDALQIRIHKAHRLFLKVTDDLSEEQLRWLPSDTAPPIRWHLWHVARCTDLAAGILASPIGAPDEEVNQCQIWYEERLAEAWGLSSEQMGHRGLGTHVENAVAAGMPLPAKAKLIDYYVRSFQTVERVLDGFTAHDFDRHGDSCFLHVTHTSRHLGMVEALRGVLGMDGTATQ